MYPVPDLSIESKFPGMLIAGVDEAGCGPLAGPVVAGAVILTDNSLINLGVRDSKCLSAKARAILYQHIISKHCYSVGIATVAEIDHYNIHNAAKLACIRAVEALKVSPQIVIVDGRMRFDKEHYYSFIKGDQQSISIAAASIIAKVSRDTFMQQLSKDYPVYNWQSNQGYPTLYHRLAIQQHGLSPWHRKSFSCKAVY